MDPAVGSAEDDELVTRAQHGDLAAFGALVARHEAMAVRVASIVAGSAFAEDAAQEGMVRAYRSLHRFDPSRAFRPWLARIVANCARNHARSERRHVSLALRSPRDSHSPDLAVESAIASARRDALAAALVRLPERDRLVLAYRWFEDMSEREIADALDVRPGTVKSRLSRAMTRLRAELQNVEVVAND